MVLIISNEFDESTNDVIRYLLINKIPFIRLTEENYVRGLNIKLSSNGIYVELKINDKIILLDEVKSFWFRKNDLELFNNERIISDLAHKHNEIEQFIFKSEIKSLRDFLIFLLEKKNFLGNINKGDGNKLIRNISLLRSSDKDSNYVFMETRNYTDSLPIFRISGKKSDDHYYYKLVIYNEDDTVYSLPYYFFTLDQKPPQPPTTIIGTVDSIGIVHLSWVAPPDDDIRGYRVFKGNAPDEDFVEQTTMLSTELSFNDTVRLDNLSSEVFYYIRSVDMNYNNSFSSDTVLLLKPDTIPPISAVLYDVIVSDTIFLVKWINSDSKDIQFNLLLRNSAERTDTLYSWADTSSFFIDSQLIPGQGYSYFIQTFDKSKNSSTTQVIYKFYEPGYRKELNDVKVKVDTKNKGIEIRWKKPDDTVFQYVIYRAKDDEKLLPLKSIENPDNFIFNDSRVSLNTKYRYSIKYINQSGIHSIPVIIEVVYQ